MLDWSRGSFKVATAVVVVLVLCWLYVREHRLRVQAEYDSCCAEASKWAQELRACEAK